MTSIRCYTVRVSRSLLNLGSVNVGRTSRWRKLSLVALATIVSYAMLGESSAFAQASGKSRGRSPRGVITLAEVTITGRIQKPIAAVDVARLRPKLALSELRQPFIGRIGEAVFKPPF